MQKKLNREDAKDAKAAKEKLNRKGAKDAKDEK